MNDLQLKLILEAIDKASPELKKVEEGVGKVGSSTKKATTSSDGFSAAIGPAGMAAAATVTVAVLVKMGMALVDVAREMQGLNAAMVTATGSERAASDEMDRLLNFAEKTPYQINEVVGAFIKLKNLGLDPSEAAMRSYGNTASSMNKSLDQMIEAVADAATGEFERLKEFGIKARQNGDSVKLTFRGVTTEIKNSAEAIEGYLRRIGEVEFAGGMDRQMETINGTISNFEDGWMQMLDAIGDSGVIDNTAAAIETLTGGMKQLTTSMRLLTEFKKGNVGFFDWLFADDQDATKILETIKSYSVVDKAIANARQRIKELQRELSPTQPQRNKEIRDEIRYLLESIAEFQELEEKRKELGIAAAHNTSRPSVPGDQSDRKTDWSKKELDAYVKSAKGVSDAWQQMHNDRNAVHSRSIDAQIQLEREAAELNKVVWETGKDFWQLQEEEKWEVKSRGLEALTELEADASKKLSSAASELGFTFSSAFEEAIIGGNGLRDVMQGLLDDILKITARKLITEPLANAISTGLGNIFPSANGNVFSGGDIRPFANGGVVSRPTFFPMTGGNTGLMGEAGEEGILPLKRINGKLGVLAEFGGGAGGNLNVQINNYGEPAQAEVQQRQSGNGTDLIITLERNMADRMRSSGSPMSRALEQTYGLTRNGGR